MTISSRSSARPFFLVLALLPLFAVPQSLYGTLPFADEKIQGPQTIPGKVWLAYFDQGGPDVSYHSYDGKNHGSCELNPCTGTNAIYKNVFRKDEGASTSYTKPPNGGWTGDRFAANNSQVPVDQMYWGWNAIGNWVRLSLLVKKGGNYTLSLFGSSNSGGTLTLTVDDYLQKGKAVTTTATIPATDGYHQWALFPDIAVLPSLPSGLGLLAVNVTGIYAYKEGRQFGNLLWFDFHWKG